MAEKTELQEKTARKEKFSQRPLKSYDGRYCAFRLLLDFRTLRQSWAFLWSVFRNFFLTQFLQKWGWIKLPVVHADHPLDKKIPWTPSKVLDYMEFVQFFLRPNTMLIKRYGIKKAAPICNEWFRLLAKAYSQAGKMYRVTLSTTERPVCKDNRHFKTIQKWDPHLLCVPSLHIAIVILVFSYFKKAFKNLGFDEDELFRKNTELYNTAIKIAESVLYIKQHSVNCIPAAIYMVTKVYPDLWTPNDSVNFINDMFLTAKDISAADCAKIKEHILFMYERFLLEGYSSDDWRGPVIRWITTYEVDRESDSGEKYV